MKLEIVPPHQDCEICLKYYQMNKNGDFIFELFNILMVAFGSSINSCQFFSMLKYGFAF